MRKYLVFFSLLAAFTTSAADALKLPAREKFHLFLLVGQSNMAGRGKVTPAEKKPIDRVLMLTKDDKWQPAEAPLHFDKPKVVGVGIGRAFAKEMAKGDPDVTIGLIPCGVGGSPIDSWKTGVFYKPTKSHPWDDALRRAKLALKAGTLKGILWHQGESDSKAGLAESYEKKLHALIARFRKELPAPNVPFIGGQMGQFAERPWSDAKKLVDRAHRELPKKVAHTGFANSDGLKHKGDKVHFNADSYRELGRRYAAEFRRLSR